MGLGFPQILLTSHWLERRVRLVTAICMLSTDAWRRERAYCPLVVLEVLASHSVTSDTTLAGAWTILAVADCHNITSSHVFLHFKLFWPIHKVDRRPHFLQHLLKTHWSLLFQVCLKLQSTPTRLSSFLHWICCHVIYIICRGPGAGWKRISRHEAEWEGNKVY